MGRYIARRALLMVPALFGISIAVFLLLHLIPGNVVDSMLGADLSLPPEVRANLERTFGLDKPMHLQYLSWMADVVRGDLGRSLRTNESVSSILLSRLPVTAELAFLSLGLAVTLSLPLGVVSAVRRNSRLDFLARIIGLIGLSIPNFWLATMLILVTSLWFRWLPSIIYVPLRQSPTENLQQMLIPTIALALPLMAVTMRMTRSAMLEVLRQDYVRTARAKGVREHSVNYGHALANALIPIVTIIGIQMGYLLGGAVIIEQIFGLPGLGWMILNGIFQRDYPVVQGGILFIATMFLVLNLLVDVTYAYLDPRIKYS